MPLHCAWRNRKDLYTSSLQTHAFVRHILEVIGMRDDLAAVVDAQGNVVVGPSQFTEKK